MVRSANISAIFGYHYGAGGGYTRARSCRTSRELIMHPMDARKRLCFTPMGCTGNNFSINFRPVKSTIFCQRISKGKLLFFANSGMIILTIRSLNGYQTPRNRLYTEPRCRIPCNGTTATAYTSATGAIDIAKRGVFQPMILLVPHKCIAKKVSHFDQEFSIFLQYAQANAMEVH